MKRRGRENAAALEDRSRGERILRKRARIFPIPRLITGWTREGTAGKHVEYGAIAVIPPGINNPRGINALDMQEVLCASVHRTDLSPLPARRWQMDRPFPREPRPGVGPRLTNVDRKLNDANNHYNTPPRSPVSTPPRSHVALRHDNCWSRTKTRIDQPLRRW